MGKDQAGERANVTGFSDRQVNALRRAINGAHVRTRRVEGRELSYIEGWHAIAEANRIFGFDHWDRETVESRCVLARENRGSLHTVYVAKVRITVRAAGEVIVREGYGTGESLGGGTLGEAHERALKMAETDATKRALATFGKPFGLGLYLSPRRSPQPPRSGYDPNTATPIPDHQRRRTLQRLGPNGRYHAPQRPRVPIDPALQPSSATDQDSMDTPTSAEAGLVDPEGGAHRDQADDRAPHSEALDGDVGEQRTTAPADSFRSKPLLEPESRLEPRSCALPSAPRGTARPSTIDSSAGSSQPIANAEHRAAVDAKEIPIAPMGAPRAAPQPAPMGDPSGSDSGEEGRLLIDWTKRRREPAHLKFVASQPCLVCGRTPSDAHHLKFAQPRALGRKVSDEFTVPLCRVHHRELHRFGNEADWWEAWDRDVDPLEIAKGLWDEFHQNADASSTELRAK